MLGENSVDNSTAYEISFKGGSPSFVENNLDWSKYDGDWHIIKNWDLNNRIHQKKFSQVSKLPLWNHTNYIGITRILDMYWLKYRSLNIKDFYGEKMGDSIPCMLHYHIVENVPLLV